MEDIFIKLVNMSITAGWLILAVAALRLLLMRAPRWIVCLMWALVAVRLICPVSLESAFSMVPSRETIRQDIAVSHRPAIDSGVVFVDDAVNSVLEDSFVPASEDSANPLQTGIFLASILWAAGGAVMLVYAAFGYFRLRLRVRTAVREDGNLYRSEFVDTPFILGIVRPRIYLPSHMEEATASYVTDHERAHIKRGDHLWKPLAYLLLSVYWFQPLCWLAYVLLCRDIELACDERVIRGYDSGRKKRYSEALLACSVNRRTIAACPLAFGEVGVKKRVRNVLNYKRPAFWIVTAAVVVCIAAAVCFLTDPVKQNTDSADVSNTASNTVNVLERLSRVDWDGIRGRNLTVDGDKDWTDIVCLGRIPEKDITVYGYNDQECFGQGVAVEIEDSMYYFDWVYTTPRALLPDCYWNESDGQLQIALNVYTGTGVSAQELHVLRYRDGRLTDCEFDLQEYSEILKQRIQSAYDSETRQLTLTDGRTGKELYTVEIAGEDKDITGIEAGMISEFILGDTVSLQVEPGCFREGEAAAVYQDNMPVLKAEVMVSENGDGLAFDLGEFYAVQDSEASRIMYYIRSVEGRNLAVDTVEWVEVPGSRASQLGLDEDDAPSGFVLYNEEEKTEIYPLADDCTCTVLDWKNNYEQKTITADEMLGHRLLDERDTAQIPYLLTITDGEIVSLSEQYVP